jgi:recombination protein RecA
MSLINALIEINKTYGDNTANRIKDMGNVSIAKVSTGSMKLDVATDGGYPKGGHILIYGGESSGKSTLAILAIKAMQKANPDANIAFIDAESSFDFEYAKAQGVNTDNIIFCQPVNGDDAIEICKSLLKTGEMDLIVMDSIAAMKPKKVIEGDITDADVGIHAKMINKAFAQTDNLSVRTETLIFWINQTREKIGVMFGSNVQIPAGVGQRFHSRMMIEIYRGKTTNDKDGVPEFRDPLIKIAKNKVGKPNMKTNLRMHLGFGFQIEDEILSMGVDGEVLTKSGHSYMYGEQRLGKSKSLSIQFLKDNPEISNEIEQKVREVFEISFK